MYIDPKESTKNQPEPPKKKQATDPEKDKKNAAVAQPDYSHDVNCYLVKREKTQPGPGNQDVLKKMGKYHDDGKKPKQEKPKTDDKEKDKKKKKEDNFPGPGTYNPFGEGKKLADDKGMDKGKKDDKKNDKALEYATYLTENLCLTHLAPGPGNYNPNDNAVWNKIARENADKKGAPQTKAKTEDKKDKANDKKKGDKPFPGPGQYDMKSEFI